MHIFLFNLQSLPVDIGNHFQNESIIVRRQTIQFSWIASCDTSW